MENASKAILIAGGVLLAIIVISICMLVISNAREAFVSMEEKRQAQNACPFKKIILLIIIYYFNT